MSRYRIKTATITVTNEQLHQPQMYDSSAMEWTNIGKSYKSFEEAEKSLKNYKLIAENTVVTYKYYD